MVYTSYFGNITNVLASVPDAGLVSIAGKTPDGFTGCKYKPLMPHLSWWKEWHDRFADDIDSTKSREWYIDKYYNTVLAQLNPLQVARDLKDLAEWKPVFMLCYETPEKFCHRHIVAEWLEKYHVPCEEWKEG